MSHLGIVTYLCMFSFLKVKFMQSFVIGLGLGNRVAFNFSIFGIVTFVYVQFIVFTKV